MASSITIQHGLGAPPIWTLTASEKCIAVVSLLASLVARPLAFLPGYAVDDYMFFLLDDSPEWASAALSQGRVGFVLLHKCLSWIGAAPPYAGALSAFLLSCVLVAVGLAVCRMWRVSDPKISAVIVLFFCLHPYQAEVFTFRIAVLPLALSLAAAFYALVACQGSRWAQLRATAIFACALLTYQIVLNYVAMALLFSAVFHLARLQGIGANSTPEPIPFPTLLRRQLLAVSGGAVCAAVIGFGAAAASDVALTSRTELLGIHDIPARAIAVGQFLWRFLALNEPVVPIGTKWLLLSLVLVGAMLSIAERPSSITRIRLAMVTPYVTALVAGLPAILGLLLCLDEWWPVPRVCAQAGLFWGGLFTLVFTVATARARRVMLVLAGGILFSFAAMNNRVLNDQFRLNMRDIAKANRILMQVEALPEFDKIRSVALAGGSWAYRLPLHTVDGDLNISALYRSYSKLALLNEVSGYGFHAPTPAMSKRAEDRCRETAKWPAPESVSRMEDFAIVCLAGE